MTFLDLLPAVFTQLLLLAQTAGVLRLGTISLDGTKIHADASKSQAVSYAHLLALEERIRNDVATLLTRAAQADTMPLPEGLVVAEEIADRQARLLRLAEAKAVLVARAADRYAAAQAAYAAQVQERAERARWGANHAAGLPNPRPRRGRKIQISTTLPTPTAGL